MPDKAYWNERYRDNRMGWNVGYATPPLTAYAEQLPSREMSVLLPGAGNAYEAEYLYHQGFQSVYVLDWSEWALENFHQRVPGFPIDQLMVEDFFAHEGQYDIILEQTFFCALEPRLRQDYVRKMYELLKPGGILAGVLFSIPLYSDHPPYGGHAGEYRALFEPMFHIKTLEPCRNSIPERAGNEVFIEMVRPDTQLN